MHGVIVSAGRYQHAGRCRCHDLDGACERLDCQDHENPPEEADEEQGRKNTAGDGDFEQHEKY